MIIGITPIGMALLLFRKKKPAIRRWRAIIFPLAAVSGLAAGMLVVTWLNANIGYGFYQESYGDTSAGQEVAVNYKNAMIRENFLRQILPPPWRRDCALGDHFVCQQIDLQNQWRSEAIHWSNYRTNLSLAGVSALSAGLFSAFYLRTRSKMRRKVEYES